MRYVALGDSYTIGTSVRPVERWPDQLVAVLGPDEPALHLVANLAVDGYTSTDLIREELPALDDLEADDGLHPSGAQYALWVERIAPVVAAQLGR